MYATSSGLGTPVYTTGGVHCPYRAAKNVIATEKDQHNPMGTALQFCSCSGACPQQYQCQASATLTRARHTHNRPCMSFPLDGIPYPQMLCFSPSSCCCDQSMRKSAWVFEATAGGGKVAADVLLHPPATAVVAAAAASSALPRHSTCALAMGQGCP